MKSTATTTTMSRPAVNERTLARMPAALFALLLGTLIVYGAGFAPVAAVHNAAHDGRHVFAFPCH